MIKEAETDFVNYKSVINHIACDQDLIYLSMFDSLKVKDSIAGIIADSKIVFSDETIAFVQSQFNDNSKLSSIVNEQLNKVKLYSNIDFKTASFKDLAHTIANIRIDSFESFSNDIILVILATYNPDIDLLKISIDSILNQTHSRFILAVVDDCSTNSKNISDLVNNYSDERLHYFNMEQNSGPYKCRNYVIQKFDFDFVTFQDDDDVSHPQRLEYELSQLHNSDAKIVACSNIRFAEDGHIQIDNDGSFFSYGPVTMMIRREVFESIGLFKEYKSRGDVEFRKRVLKHFGEDAYVQLELPLYFSLGGHLTLSSSFEYGKDYSKLSLIRQIMLKDKTKNIKSLQTKREISDKVFDKNKMAPTLKVSENPKVSVIMTSYNTADYIEKAIRSILNQTYSNLELIVVDDCSTDATRDIVSKIATTDDRVKLFCFGENRGTYFAKNFGMTKSSGDIITFMDSDDTSDLKRIQIQLNHLDNYIGCVCKYERRDLKGNIVTSNGRRARVALISLMFRKEILNKIGYFDTVRTSADDEFRERIRTVYGQDSIKTISEILYHAILRDESLTNEQGNAINLTPNREKGESFLPPSRASYLKGFQCWHKYCNVNNMVPYIPFPVRCRPFSATGKLVVANGIYDNNSVSVCLASFPPREKKLKKVVESFLDQVDGIYVYLNDYKDIPEFLKHPKIHVKLGNDAYGDLRDNGKMYFMDTVPNGYCFTMDDDINYPDDYIEKMIRKIEIYERKAIVGIHGTIFAKPFENYFKNRTVFHFKNKLERDVVVNQLGTGTVGFHTSLIRPSLEEFYDVGMADVFMAIIAKKNNIPLICIERDESWISAMERDEGGDLYREFIANDYKQTKYISQILPFEEKISGELGLSLKNKIEKYGDVFAKNIIDIKNVSL
jgi:glycosyltransferase involved in cell wall biosynthesis